MAQGQIPVNPISKPKKVFCSSCPYFQRDTDGISYNRETGEYFLGICTQGLHPDTVKKQFANKPRFCEKHPDNA